ncbi:MAG: prolyl oligopeptidase family serine peptidase [Bryobacteraceae bacterium]|nr:prolyl oligopeptidase family serine peptidase [Bryobacteraceae bacterium]
MHFLMILALVAQQLYEDEPTATMPLRERNWKQLESYTAKLAGQKEGWRRTYLASTGYPAPGLHATPGKPRMEKAGEDELAIYYRCWIEVGPELETYGLYIVPKKKASARLPLVIAKHGGGGYPEMALFRNGSNYHDMIRGAAREGYLVYAPLTVMYPFRDRDKGSPIPVEVRAELDDKLRAAGTSLMGLEVSKMVKALDSLLKHQKEIDPQRIAMIGLSYGGYYTLYMAAVDPRIRAAVASCSFLSDVQPRGKSGKIEGRPLDLAPPELAGLIAPRPLQVQSGVSDKGFPIADVRVGAERARSHYAREHADGAFEFREFEGGHEFKGELAWEFLRRHLAK